MKTIHRTSFKDNSWSLGKEGSKAAIHKNNVLFCSLPTIPNREYTSLISTPKALLLLEKPGFKSNDNEKTIYSINKNEISNKLLCTATSAHISSPESFQIRNDLILFYKKFWRVAKINEDGFKVFDAFHDSIPSIQDFGEQVLHSSYDPSLNQTIGFVDDKEIMNFNGKLRFSGIHKRKPLVIASNKTQYCIHWRDETKIEEGTLEKIDLKRGRLTYNLADHSWTRIFSGKPYQFTCYLR